MALPPIRQKLLSPLNDEFQKLLRLEVATRCMGTAAVAREIPRTRKRVSKLERRAMVEEYVNEYRVMNSGKFPTAKNVKEQIGGCYYKVRAILQELEYNYKLPAVSTAANSSTIQQAALVNRNSDARLRRVTPDCQVSDKDNWTAANNSTIQQATQVNRNPDARLRRVAPDCQVSDKDNWTAAVNDSGTSAECYSIDKVDKNSGLKMADKSTLNQNHAMTAKYVSGSERENDLELGEDHVRASSDVGKSNKERILESHSLPGISTVVKRTLAKDPLMAMTMDDSLSPPKPSHPSQITSTSENPKPKAADEDSGQAFEADELTRGNTAQEPDEVKEMQKSSLWSSLKFFASNVISRWRKI